MSPDFETSRLRLRRFNLDDFDFILNLLNSQGWLRFIGERHVKTVEQAKLYLQNGPMESYSKNGFGLYLVELKPAFVPIGMCGIIKRELLPHPDLGFAFLSEYTHRGYACEAAKAVMEEVLKHTEIKTLYGITNPLNADSKKLLTKLGFVFEKSTKLNKENEVSDLFLIQLNKTG